MSQKEGKMKTLKLALAASLLAGTLAVTAAPANAAAPAPVHTGGTLHASTAYWILACPAGIVTSAMVKNWRRPKELTAQEAWTCGPLYWWNEGIGMYGN